MDETMAGSIVDAIIADLSDRAGLGNEWNSIDEYIENEIREEWIEIIMHYSK